MRSDKTLEIMKALGDSSRLMIMDSLKIRPQYVEELAERLNLAVSTVSFHLKKLESAGLVSGIKEQYYAVYSINESLLDHSLNELISSREVNRTGQDRRAESYRTKVLRSFFKKGKLEKLPSQYKKRILLYEEILRKFDKDKEYPEKQVDEKISEVCDDYCTIRRAFIDERMMFRSGGIYKINKEYKPQFPAAVKNIKSWPAYGGKGRKIKMDKSELKKAYKLSGAQMGVYKVVNPDTGNIFVGSSKNLSGVINRHKFELSTKSHRIKELQDTWNSHGENRISFEIVDILEQKEEPGYDYKEDIKELEDLWIEKFRNDGMKIVRLKTTEPAKEQ